MLVESTMPVFVRSPFWTAFLFPEGIGAFADGLFQANFCFGIGAYIVPIGLQRASVATMHPSG
jgi:hypothetical protein